MAELVTLNAEQRLYVIGHAGYVTCLGYDVAERKRRAVRAWIDPTAPDAPNVPEPGTLAHYAAYADAMADGARHAAATGKKCPADLTAALVGYEGKRVEVTTPDGEKSRFWVSRSGGWMPCHIEVKTRASSGGCAAYVPDGSTVRTVEASR